jgi:hypothetical protein
MILRMYMFYMGLAKRIGGTVAQAAAFYVLVRLILSGVHGIQRVVRMSDDHRDD